jgi:hypothetical protein
MAPTDLRAGTCAPPARQPRRWGSFGSLIRCSTRPPSTDTGRKSTTCSAHSLPRFARNDPRREEGGFDLT